MESLFTRLRAFCPLNAVVVPNDWAQTFSRSIDPKVSARRSMECPAGDDDENISAIVKGINGSPLVNTC